MSTPVAKSQFWACLSVVGLLAAAVAPHSFLFGATDWETVYLPAADRYERGEDIYDDTFVYPPFMVLIAWPAAHLPEPWVRIHLWLSCTAGAALLVCGAWWLTGGRFSFANRPREWGIAAVGLTAYLGYVFEVMVNRQTDLFVGGLATIGAWLIVRRKEWAGGALIGLAAAAKCTPLLFAPYLFLAGRWRAGVAALLATVVATLLPDLFVRPPTNRLRAIDWAERYLLPLGKPSDMPRHQYAAEWSNHSLTGWAIRVSSYDLLERVPDIRTRVKPDHPSPTAVKLAAGVVGLGLLGLAAWRFWGRYDAAGVGATFCLMLLLSPMSSKPHFCVLAVPAWAVIRAGIERKRWDLIVLVGVAGVCTLLSAKDLSGGVISTTAMWWGVNPLGAAALLAGCLLLPRKPLDTTAPAEGAAHVVPAQPV